MDDKTRGDEIADTNDLAIADLGDPPNLTADEETAPQPRDSSDAKNASLVIGPKVPDFGGMSMRAVLEQSSALGLPVDYVGRGIVRAQYPAPGNVLQAGERVRVQFSRR